MEPEYDLVPVNYDPFERAAQRVRQSVKPEGGRTEGVGTDLATKLIPGFIHTFTQPIIEGADTMRRASEGNITSENPEDIWKTFQSAGAAATGALPFAERGALGSAGGKLMQMENKAPPFYSALEHAVENTKQQKMPADQWLGTISNSKGVKPEELDWTGFKDFLAEKGKQPVTKAEVQEHLSNNKVELKEINKGHYTSRLEELQRQQQQAIRDTFTDEPGANERLDQINRELKIASEEHKNAATKYSQYQLPGGENYREMLMTLPEKENPRIKEIENRLAEINNLPARETNPGSPNYEKYTKEWDALQAERASLKNPNPYTSSHWDEPNILAHVRMNDRNIEGKKSLHLEEIQSDWHQQGREKGYKGDSLSPLTKAEEEEMEALSKKDKWTREEDDRYANLLEKKQGGVNDDGVPQAPFKKSWHELALKRMIREAAEKGYDRLSWTPGEAQAARYDLSKSIDELHYNPETHKLVAKKNGNHIVDNNNVPPDKLADYVGKEAAKKIMDQEPNVNGLRSLKNQELRIGGEGMKGFYDQIIPKAIEKIGKEHGVKVKQGTTEIDSTPYRSQAHFIDWVENGGGREARHYGRTELAKKWAKGENDPLVKEFLESKKPAPVHYIDIPESLKNVATQKGFPLFASGLPVTFTPVDGDPHK